MVDDLRSAGVDVTLEVSHTDRRPVAEDVGRGAFRIVQESLTNAVKHGGPDVSVEVTLDHGANGLTISVADDGPGAPPAGFERSGSGLTAMAERASVLGGTLAAGPRPGGGFLVTAELPVPHRAGAE